MNKPTEDQPPHPQRVFDDDAYRNEAFRYTDADGERTTPAPETTADAAEAEQRRPHPAPSAGAPRWYTSAGVIQGFRSPVTENPDVEVLRATGIPYAYANRHEVPQPLTELPDGIVVADRPGPTCPQRPSPAAKKIAPHARPRHHDEHCQHLALTIPDGTSPDAKLPVMVWIHGGANISGGGDLPRFDPSQMAADNNVIVASITFRLGAYGFLGGGDDRADGVPPANLGLMDIQSGLEWIRANISAFGGDPDQITMFGQSAGADLILALMVAAGADKLEASGPGRRDVDKPYAPPFRRAILQSLPFGFLGGRTPMYDAMVAAAGPIDRATSHDDIAAAEVRATEAARSFKNGQAMPWGVRYGAAPLPDESLFDACLDAIAGDIDILVGRTPRESALFLHDAPEVARLKKVPVAGGPMFEGILRAVTKKTYGGSSAFAQKWAAAGGKALHYTLTWGAKRSKYRSAHTCDLPLLFGDESEWRDSILLEGQMWTDVRRDRKSMQAMWTQFAKTGGIAQVLLDAAPFLTVEKVEAK